MTPNKYESGRRPRREASDRYVAFETGDETLVIYDTINHRAWIESSAAVSLAAMA